MQWWNSLPRDYLNEKCLLFMEKQDWTWQHGEITLLNLIIAQHDEIHFLETTKMKNVYYPGIFKRLQTIAQHGEIHFIETTSPTKRESTPQTWLTSWWCNF